MGLRIWDADTNQGEPQALHDFVAWRGELDSVEESCAVSRPVWASRVRTGRSCEDVPT